MLSVVNSFTPPGEIASAMVRELFAYWQKKSAGRIAPKPRDIEPGDLKRLLPFIAISDVLHDPFTLRFRLVGTSIVEAVGYDFTGKRFDEMPITTGLEIWMAHYRRVVERKGPHYGRYRGELGPETVRYVDHGAFPLSSSGDSVDRIIEIEDWGGVHGVGLGKPDMPIWHFQPLPGPGD